MKPITKWVLKIIGCIFAWIIIFIMANFIAGPYDWIHCEYSIGRFGYIVVSIFSNIFIIGGEYLS